MHNFISSEVKSIDTSFPLLSLPFLLILEITDKKKKGLETVQTAALLII